MARALYFIIFVILVVGFRLIPVHCNIENLIEIVCTSTEDRGFCSRVFHQNLKSPNTNMRGLAEIAIEQGINNASVSAGFGRDLFYKSTDQALKDYLQVCVQSGYVVALKNLQKGQADLRQSKYDDMVTVLLDGAKSQARNCDVDPVIGRQPNPMEERNREVRILLTMTVITANELQRGTPASGN